MQTKLQDIAKATGYSINTVSRALKGDTRISEATRSVISKKAKELHYIPNAIASTMRSVHSRTIGVLSADSGNPFFSEVGRGIESEADNLGYHILLGSTEESLAKEEALLTMFLSMRVDGIIAMPVYDTSASHLELYQSLPVPFLFAGRSLPGLEDHCVLHDDRQGQKAVTDYLLESGHTHILYLMGPKNVSNAWQRLEGMKSSFEEHGFEQDDEYLVSTDGHTEDGYAAMNQALNRGLEITAVACFNDLLAMGVLKSLSENGLSCPEDVEVVGFDNLYMSQFMEPSLTTVDVPKFRLGHTAMKKLVTHIEQPSEPYREEALPIRMVFRESTRKRVIR